MGSEKQGLKKILAFLRRLGLVASSRRSDKERAAWPREGEGEGGGEGFGDTNAKFAFQEHGLCARVYEQPTSTPHAGCCCSCSCVVAGGHGGGGTPPSNDFNEPPS